MVGWIPRVNGNSPGNPSFDAGSHPARSSGVSASRVVLTVIGVGRSARAGDGEIVLRPYASMRDRAAEYRNQQALSLGSNVTMKCSKTPRLPSTAAKDIW